MKVACLNKISPVGTKVFPETYQLTDVYEGAELVMVRSASMHELSIHDELLAVARAGAGVNNIPLDVMAERGVVVFNTPGANANGVKELVIAGMLLASRDIIGGVEWVKAHSNDPMLAKSVEKAKAAYGGTELYGKTLAIIGLGAIGAKLAIAAVHLGMKVIGYDPYLTDDTRTILPESVELYADIDRIYPQADFISLHVPLVEETTQMMNHQVFLRLKPGTILLNFSRDKLVDDDALEQAIASGLIRKYVTDFPNPKTAQMQTSSPFLISELQQRNRRIIARPWLRASSSVILKAARSSIRSIFRRLCSRRRSE
ncbi:MAG: 3-phosphoglycerate dehydrogenase [Candidatus Izemoplasmatales bacterium]|jgi:D-3-phosphoglycerate dehydrogenase